MNFVLVFPYGLRSFLVLEEKETLFYIVYYSFLSSTLFIYTIVIIFWLFHVALFPLRRF